MELLIASRKMSASCAPTKVAFPPSPYYLFTVFSSAWLSHTKSMGFITRVPRHGNAKTTAASSGRFELEPSSSRPTFLCCLFFLTNRFTYPASISPLFEQICHLLWLCLGSGRNLLICRSQCPSSISVRHVSVVNKDQIYFLVKVRIRDLCEPSMKRDPDDDDCFNYNK